MTPRLAACACFALLLASCYSRELHYSFEPSSGGAALGPDYYYLAQVREFRTPRGISRFPDGGQVKVVRHVFGLFKTGSADHETVLAAAMGHVRGWPAKYAARLDAGGNLVALGLYALSSREAVDGVYLFDVEKKALTKHNEARALPALSPDGSRIAYVDGGKIVIEECGGAGGAALFSHPLETNPVFVDWKEKQAVFLYLSDPFRVRILSLETGRIDDSGLEYLPGYGQDISITEIRQAAGKSAAWMKEILDACAAGSAPQ